jgi:hypothetical protein
VSVSSALYRLQQPAQATAAPSSRFGRMEIDMFAGEMRARLDVLTGGAIAALTWRGLDILRPVRDERLGAQHGRAVAAYPLIPYANRINQGRFVLDGKTYQLALNFGDHPHSLHGNGWMRAWSMAEATPARVRLTLAHRPPHDPASEWPFAYDAEQVFSLTEDRLSVQLSVRNADTQNFPAGLGLHPYVARTASTILGFTADTINPSIPRGRSARTCWMRVLPAGAAAPTSRRRSLVSPCISKRRRRSIIFRSIRREMPIFAASNPLATCRTGSTGWIASPIKA